MAKKIGKRDDLTPDARNANKGTERGRHMLEQSMRECGPGRSILADKEGQVIAGNKTLEAAAALDIPIRVVVTDGKELVVVQRCDIEPGSELERKMAYYDNRSSEVGLAWDAQQVAADLEAGLDLGAMFTTEEIHDILDDAVEIEPYSRKIEPPIYVPVGVKPDPKELFDSARADRLAEGIRLAEGLTDGERAFLLAAAQRHVVFDYRRIADFYAHSSPAVQRLMEDSALVIIDFQRAIELGFVRMSEAIAAQVMDEYGD